MARLGDVCNIRGGYAFKSDLFSDKGIPVVRISNITESGLEIDDRICFEEAFWEKNKNYRVNYNDILVAMSGATVGKSCINKNDDKLLLNQRVASISAGDSVENEYVYYFISSPAFTNYVLEQSVGCAQPNISIKQLSDIDLRIPTLKEQSEIVKILVKTDELICVRKKQLSKLDELVKSRFVEMFGDVKTNEFGWKKCRFGDISAKITDGEHGTVPRVNKDEGYLYFMARNITKDGTVDLSETSYVPKEVHRKIYKRCNPEKDDILLVCVGATIGKCTIVPENLGEFSMARSVALIKPDKQKVNSVFLISLLKSDAIQSDISECAHAAAQAGLYTNMIINLDAFLPPLELQNQFATFVEQTDKSKIEVKESLEKLEILKKALMQEYFG